MQYCTSSDSEAIGLGNNRCMHTSMDDTHLVSHTPLILPFFELWLARRAFLCMLDMMGMVQILGVVSGCPLFRSNFVLKNHIGIHSLVRSLESRSVRFSEVM